MKALVTVISRAPQIAADSLAVGVTWYKLWRNRCRGLLGKPSLADVFLRDGVYARRYESLTCSLTRLYRHNILPF